MKGEGIRRLGFVLAFVWRGLAAIIWIPAFAGMTGGEWEKGSADCARRLVSGGWVVHGLLDSRFRGNDGGRKRRRDPLTALGAWFRAAGLFADFWIPAFAGMTGGEIGNDGGGESGNCRGRNRGDGVGRERELQGEKSGGWRDMGFVREFS